jgi:ribosome maturation protein SDO1
VLQTASIFTNVSKGQIASKEELEKCFKSTDEQRILLEILKKGELQVSTLERNSQMSSTQKDIVQIICSKSVNPETKRPYPASIIEKALADLHYNVKPNKSAKQQALEIIKLLQNEKIIPISRAQMRVLCSMASKDFKRLKEKLLPFMENVVSEDHSTTEYQMVSLKKCLN